MTYAATTAASSSAAAEAIANAVKASGAIVQVEPIDFAHILARSAEPLVVHAIGRKWSGFLHLSPMHQYLTSYKGLFFYTTTIAQPFPLPANVELVECKKIWIPG